MIKNVENKGSSNKWKFIENIKKRSQIFLK